MRVGNGRRCVILMIESPYPNGRFYTDGAITLSPEGARALAAMLREQADYSERPDPEDPLDISRLT